MMRPLKPSAWKIRNKFGEEILSLTPPFSRQINRSGLYLTARRARSAGRPTILKIERSLIEVKVYLKAGGIPGKWPSR